LPNTDRFAANARREMTERIIVQHLAAGQAGAGLYQPRGGSGRAPGG
jgi:hypothetical protein